MLKYATNVRFLVKEGEMDACLNAAKSLPNCGELHCYWYQTGDNALAVNSIFESEEALMAARPKMIENLNQIRHLLKEISPEFGITNPVSGPIFDEK